MSKSCEFCTRATHNRLTLHASYYLNAYDEALLMSMADYMSTFKQLLDICTGAEMDALCERYDGFYRFATLLERLAGSIADGNIPVPG